MYIIVYFLLVYNFTDRCHRVETQFQLINIIYHIIYSTTYIAISHYRFISHNLKLSHLLNVCNTHVNSFLQNSMVCVRSVFRHLPSPFRSQWYFSCHHTVNGRFMFRELPSSCSAFCEDAGITNFVRVSNNTGFQNPAVRVTSTLKVSRGRHVGIIGIKTERRNQVVIREALGLNLDWELGYSSSVDFLIPSGQMPGLFLNVGYDLFLPQLVVFTVGGSSSNSTLYRCSS